MPRRLTSRAVALMTLVFLAGVIPARGAATQWSIEGLTDSVYTSPTWGYSVRWHAAEWATSDQQSSAGTDRFWLAKPSGESVSYEGTDRFGEDTAACRRQALEDLGLTPGVSDVEVVPNDSGTLIWYEDPTRAYGLYVYRLQQGASDGDWLRFIDCQSLVPGEALLLLVHDGPADAYDVDHLQLGRVIPSRRSVYPAVEMTSQQGSGAWWRLSGPSCSFAGVADSILDAQFANAQPAPDHKFVWVRLHFYNTALAQTPLTVDASHYVLVDRNDFRYPLRWFLWFGAPGPSDAAVQEIPPHTAVDLDIVFEIPASVEPGMLQKTSQDANQPAQGSFIHCWLFQNGEPVRPFEVREPQITFVFDRTTTELGMIAWIDAADDANGDALLLLRFTNTGSDDWEIRPYEVLFENTFDGPDGILEYPWSATFEEFPDRAVNDVIDLAPGEETTIRYAFPTGWGNCTRIGYVAAPDQLVRIGHGPCSGSAGGRPRLRGSS